MLSPTEKKPQSFVLLNVAILSLKKENVDIQKLHLKKDIKLGIQEQLEL